MNARVTCSARAWSLALFPALVACQPCRAIECIEFKEPKVRQYANTRPGRDDRIAVIGDVQRTSLEGCALGNEVNDDEQRTLLKDLHELDPAAVLLLGDMVFLGDSPRHWAYFDHLMVESKLADKPLLPLLGNHEYLFAHKNGLPYVRERFADLREHTYYAFTWGSVRMLMLDSNSTKLCESEFRREMNWLSCELDAVHRGCARGVIFFSHQSPFTQSPWVKEDETLRKEVLPKFCAIGEGLAFISAHAHGYERWVDVPVPGCRERHTPFIVSAGGGGPRPPHRRHEAPYDAALFHEWPRPFNYLSMTQSDSAVDVQVRVLRKGEELVLPAPEEAQRLALAPPKARAESCDCPR